MTLKSIKPVAEVTNPQATANSYVATIVSAILFLNEEVKNQFYKAPSGDAPTDPTAVRGEALFNDRTSDVYGSGGFAATIEALTGYKVRDFSDFDSLVWHVGMVVTPATPQYRDRTEDGYELGENYLITNQTYGLARSIKTATVEGLKEHFNPMSRLNDEWTLVTDVNAITTLVTGLVEARGIKFVEDILVDKFNSGKALEKIVREYLSD